ncbi:MAG: TIGR04255 family protein [Ferrovum myxofaciens]|nr:MAG: TIGR04255 family protein [Ferrovum myxofaciens]
MSNAPVYYALAQAQFNPVAAMAKYIDEVQDHLRQESYTLFEPQQVTHLQLTAAHGQSLTEPQVAHTTSWLITKGDRTSGFILNASSITFHTTHYETSNEFIPELLRGLRAIHAVVNLDHVGRLGLRYLDAVLPKPDEMVDQYLAGGLHGVQFGAKQRYALNESVFETESGPLLPMGTLVARVHRMTSTLGYPPDMVPNGLMQMTKFAINDVCSHAVIDTDHFVEGRMPLNFDKLGEQLSALHATIKLVFDATITDHARATWA